jgi:hypothetical protein
MKPWGGFGIFHLAMLRQVPARRDRCDRRRSSVEGEGLLRRSVACESELWPLDMISGKKGAKNLFFEVAHRGRGKHLAQEERCEPPGSLADSPEHLPGDQVRRARQRR